MPLRLSAYIARRVLIAILCAFAGIWLLIFVIDFVELLRRLGSDSSVSAGDLMILAAQRTPFVSEQTLPFAVLFATIAAFVTLSRKMELVVARATGVSIWQILMPALIVAALVGIAATSLYNPVSAKLRELAAEREASVLRGSKKPDGLRWIRQRSVDGQSIMRAEASLDRGNRLSDVTAFVFSADGAFEERVEAPAAILRAGFWELRDARVFRIGSAPANHSQYLLATNLTPDQVAQTLVSAESVPFWELPEVILETQRAGLPALRFQMQYQSLIARPALLVSMVLIAATVSLGFVRTGGIARAILGGVGAGFVLYVLSQVAEDLGAAGFILPAIAAWTPAIVGALMSVTVLLFQEDG